MEITPVQPHFGARVEGVDLTRPLDGKRSFSRRFGPLETTIRSVARTDRYHPNSSFKPVPALASLLSAREVPPAGGETEFASLRHAWATLPEATRQRLAGLVAGKSIAPGLFDPEHERELPPVRQALVRENPVHGRPALYLGSHAWYVEGMEHAESRRLLDELLAHATRPETVYQHRWRVGDLVMWDNRAVLHRGRPWDAARHRWVMRRTTIAGAAPTAAPPYATRTAVWEGIMGIEVCPDFPHPSTTEGAGNVAMTGFTLYDTAELHKHCAG